MRIRKSTFLIKCSKITPLCDHYCDQIIKKWNISSIFQTLTRKISLQLIRLNIIKKKGSLSFYLSLLLMK